MKRLALVLLCSTLLAAVPPLGGAEAADPPVPTIVVILTDDQRVGMLWAMPHVERDLVDHGVNFTNAFVTNSLCCPSRASILTGQYSHSNGVYRNRPPNGGFESFQPHESSTIATSLQDAGYTTALVGKYLNHYGAPGRNGYVPPGWSRWVALAVDTVRYYNEPLNVDGTVTRYGHAPGDYSTDVLSRDAVDIIHETNGPLFLYFTPSAPHAPANPAPRDTRAFSDLPPWRSPNYDEADVSDKPEWVQSLPRFTAARKAREDHFRRLQYQSLLAVDRAVGKIVDALQATDRLSNSMIVFMSDNGMGWGEHRWTGKKDAYEESIRVPMIVRYDPMVTAHRSDPHLVLNIDLAPTFADLAGTQLEQPDGRSFLPLLGSDQPSPAWRTDFLVEHLRDEDAPVPTYCAVRNEQYLYVVYETGEEELYDIQKDPYELNNRAFDPTLLPTLFQLRQRAKQLCSPPPPGFTFPY
ncbi:MAG: sulfatase [Actinomycetota bacterium]